MHKLEKYLRKGKVMELIDSMYLDLQEQRKDWWELLFCDAEFYWKEEILIEIKTLISKMKSDLL